MADLFSRGFGRSPIPALHRTRDDQFVVDLDIDTCLSRSIDVLGGGWFRDLRVYETRRQVSANFRRRSASCLVVATLRPDGPATRVNVQATTQIRGLVDLLHPAAREAMTIFRSDLMAAGR